MDNTNNHNPYKVTSSSCTGNRARNMFAISPLNSNNKSWLPNPDKDGGLSNTIATMVNSARNTKAVVTAQKIGRDQQKFTLSWSFLSKTEWESMLKFWDRHFMFRVYFYDPVQGTTAYHNFYISDRTYSYYNIDPNTGRPIAYTDCKVSMVDTGE